MRRLLALLPILLLLLPASAGAADLRTDRACYYQTPQTTVSLTGSGFTPGRPYTVALDEQPLTPAPQIVREDGTFSGAFQPASLTGTQYEKTYNLSVASDALTAATAFTVTRLFATFAPTQGVPAEMRVRFSVYGFGLDGSRPVVFVHYVPPGGGRKAKETVRLGRTRGQCGSIARTAKRRLFPFELTRYGRWVLQFDANRAYTRGAADASQRSTFAFYSLGVCVRPPNSKPLRPGQKCPVYPAPKG